MSQLIEFYRRTGTDAQGRTLDQILAFGDDEMESCHDFIQWLFPLEQASAFNSQTPILTKQDIQVFRGDGSLRANLSNSFDRFLAFLGLAREDQEIGPAADFASKQSVFTSPNHNWLRITRVLHALRLLGLEDEAQVLFPQPQPTDRNRAGKDHRHNLRLLEKSNVPRSVELTRSGNVVDDPATVVSAVLDQAVSLSPPRSKALNRKAAAAPPRKSAIKYTIR